MTYSQCAEAARSETSEKIDDKYFTLESLCSYWNFPEIEKEGLSDGVGRIESLFQ